MLAFLHTAQAHVETFSALVRASAPTLAMRHEVRAELLARAVAAGSVTAALQSEIDGVVRTLASDGARLVVCTCSTIAAAAEATTVAHCPVLRIDRPMAEEAVASGRRILVLAALSSTLVPTRALLTQVAAHAGRSPVIVEALCDGAWPLFESGDRLGYAARIAATIEAVAAPGDVVLLAQASMAPALDLVTDLGIPVLCSPSSGVKAALTRYRGLEP